MSPAKDRRADRASKHDAHVRSTSTLSRWQLTKRAKIEEPVLVSRSRYPTVPKTLIGKIGAKILATGVLSSPRPSSVPSVGAGDRGAGQRRQRKSLAADHKTHQDGTKAPAMRRRAQAVGPAFAEHGTAATSSRLAAGRVEARAGATSPGEAVL